MKNIARRSLMLLGFIASCSTVLASCKINNGSKIEDIKNLDTTITWWNNYKEPENKEDFNKTSYSEYIFEKEVIAEFNKVYPNIKVNTKYIGNYSKIGTQLNSSLSGGNTPNIASVYGDYVAGFMKAGATLVMDDYISNSDYGFGKSVDADGNIIDDASTAQSDINQSYLNGEKNQYSDGKFNSMPFSKSGETLAVNQSVFDKEGAGKAGSDSADKNGKASYVAPTSAASKAKYSVPTNYKELIATARKMKEDYPSLFKNQYDSNHYFNAVPFCYDSAENMYISFSEMMGIPYTSNKSSNVAEQVLFNNDQAKALVVQLKKWNNEGLICTQNQLPISEGTYHQYSSTMLAQGTIFMCITSTAGARYFANTDFKSGKGGFTASMNETPAIDVNCFDGAKSAPSTAKSKVIAQGPSLTFFKKSDEKQNVASFLFYKFLTNTENSARLAKQTSYFPIRNSSYETETIKNILAKSNNVVDENTSYSDKVSTYSAQTFSLGSKYTSENRWYSSPVFDLSASCRTAVGNIINTVFNDHEATTDEEITTLVNKAFATAYTDVISNG